MLTVVVAAKELVFVSGSAGLAITETLYCTAYSAISNSTVASNTPCFTSVPQVTSYEAAPSTGFKATVTVLPDAVAESPVGVGSAVKGAEEPPIEQ